MDIQGHEPRFFLGAQAFLKRNTGIPVYMEFWPYAINRSGVNIDNFFNLCESCYQEFLVGSGGKSQPIKTLREFYTGLEKAAKETKNPGCGANILLL